MKSIKLGNTNFKVSSIALGIMRMAALSPAEAAKVLQTAADCGINFIDSADIYGGGDSEKVFHEAMGLAGLKRDQFYIQSKAGIVHETTGRRYDFSKEYLLGAVDGILKRLGVDYLDSFLLHRPDPLMDPEEVAQAFDELQRSGKVRHFGVSNFDPEQILFLQENLSQRLLVNQLQFSLAHTGMIDYGMHVNMKDPSSINHDGSLLAFSRRKHMTIQAWSPFQYGMSKGTFINNPDFEKLNEKLQELADKYQVSKNAIATAWILRHPAHIQVILGTMNPEHLRDSVAGIDLELTKQEWYDLYFAAGNDLP